jgi:hypothetical protein
VYVDDLNIIGNTQDVDEARNHIKTEFEMKDLGQTKFFLGLQIEHLHSGILVHQSAYIQKILEKFNMDKSYPILQWLFDPLMWRKMSFDLGIKEKRYWDPNIPTLVSLEHLCISQIALGLIFNLRLTCLQDIVLRQQSAIGPGVNKS